MGYGASCAAMGCLPRETFSLTGRMGETRHVPMSSEAGVESHRDSHLKHNGHPSFRRSARHDWWAVKDSILGPADLEPANGGTGNRALRVPSSCFSPLAARHRVACVAPASDPRANLRHLQPTTLGGCRGLRPPERYLFLPCHADEGSAPLRPKEAGHRGVRSASLPSWFLTAPDREPKLSPPVQRSSPGGRVLVTKESGRQQDAEGGENSASKDIDGIMVAQVQ